MRTHRMARAVHPACELESRHLHFALSPWISEAIIATHAEAKESGIGLVISKMV